jgi:hypothetical protein
MRIRPHKLGLWLWGTWKWCLLGGLSINTNVLLLYPPWS